MALGPSILLPPLRDIQRRIEYVDEKYAGKMYLNVLSKEEESRVVDMGGAPRSVVYNFISTLADQLYKYNLLKSTISAEKRTKVGLITMLAVIIVTMISLILVTIFYFIIYPGIKHFTQKYDGNLVMTLQYLYFGGLAVVLSSYAIFMTITVYQKYSKIYDVYYEVESTFNTEPSIQHLVSMMTVVDKNMHLNVANQRLRCQGTNPLIGFFLHQNRGIDVRYDCVPSSIIPSSEPRNGCIGGGGGPDSVTRKSFNFSNSRSSPYVLSKDSLLNPKNLPCSIFEKRSDRLFVDPFVGKNSVVGDPQVLKKKLDKFDLYGQYNSINNAVLYFETLLSRDAMGTSSFQDEIRNEIITQMKSALDLSHLILTTNLTPSRAFLDKLPSLNKKEPISKEQFIILCLNLPISYAYYDASQRTGYYMDEKDVKDLILVYTPRNSQANANTSIGNGLSFIKRNMTMNGLSNPSLNVAVQSLPAKALLDQLFRPLNARDLNKHDNIAFEADINVQNGTLGNRYEDSYLMPKASGSRDVPEYLQLFNLSTSNQKKPEGLAPVMFIYQITSESFIQQSRSNFLTDTYNNCKPILLEYIVNKVGQIDSTYAIDIDFRMEREVREHIEGQFEEDSKTVSAVLTDTINEIPLLMGAKRREKMETVNADPDDKMSKYITFDMFMLALQSMKQEEFLQKFVYNLDVLRHTSSGLKQMNDKYNSGFAIEEKNKLMFEVSFYILVSVGLTEMVRLSGLRYIDYRCEVMNLDAEKIDMEKRYAEAEEDDKKTRQGKKRELDKSLEKVQRSVTKAANSMILYISIVFFIYIFSVSLLYAWKEKSRQVFNYNKYVMDTNGNRIVTDSEHALLTVLRLITEERQFFFTSPNYKETGDADELFFLLSKHAQIERGKDVIWTMPTDTNQDPPLKQAYLRLINIIENYKKCNMLVDSSTQNIPFPLVDTITYIMLLVMVIGVLVFAASKLSPIEHYRNLVNWKHIKNLMDQDIEIEPSSFEFICHEADENKKISYNAITLIVAIMILALGILLALSLFKNSSQFGNHLYSSNMFNEMKCY